MALRDIDRASMRKSVARNRMAVTWQPADGVGTGRVYLPDRDTRNAYMAECERQKAIPAWVRYVLAGSNGEKQRERLAECPDDKREDVRHRARDQYRQEKKNG